MTYYEKIKEFVEYKDKLLNGKYLQGIPFNQLWDVDEEKSKEVFDLLCLIFAPLSDYMGLFSIDESLCPWCLLDTNGCEKCLYGKQFGKCYKSDSNYNIMIKEYNSIIELLGEDKKIQLYDKLNELKENKK